jgi:hypothetical protein
VTSTRFNWCGCKPFVWTAHIGHNRHRFGIGIVHRAKDAFRILRKS